MLTEITPVILTFNEAANIGRTLSQLVWARRVVVVDSGSTDTTRDICASYPNVVFFVRAFTTHAEQWNWALERTQIDSPWVLALDADYFVTNDFAAELRNINPQQPEVDGYRASFRYCIFGKPLRASLYPEVTVLFRRDKARYVQDGHTQRLAIAGPVSRLNSRLLHDDRKPLSSWLLAQDRYATLECAHLYATSWRQLSVQDKLRRMIVITPILVPVYCLFVRGLIFSGLPGWLYACQRCIAECILSIKLVEQKFTRLH